MTNETSSQKQIFSRLFSSLTANQRKVSQVEQEDTAQLKANPIAQANAPTPLAQSSKDLSELSAQVMRDVFRF